MTTNDDDMMSALDKWLADPPTVPVLAPKVAVTATPKRTRGKGKGVFLYLTRKEARALYMIALSGMQGDGVVGPEIESIADKIHLQNPELIDEQAKLWEMAGEPHYGNTKEHRGGG